MESGNDSCVTIECDDSDFFCIEWYSCMIMLDFFFLNENGSDLFCQLEEEVSLCYSA